jgi:hypothetical protein
VRSTSNFDHTNAVWSVISEQRVLADGRNSICFERVACRNISVSLITFRPCGVHRNNVRVENAIRVTERNAEGRAVICGSVNNSAPQGLILAIGGLIETAGGPNGNRTRVPDVRGRCPNR